MADISTELRAISEAVYGEQVRGAIVDALEAMNENAEAAEAWATGGSGGTAGAQNNAKYYAEQAAQSASTFDVDDTLSIEGKAADAAAVGSGLESLGQLYKKTVWTRTWAQGTINTTTGEKASSTTRIRLYTMLDISVRLEITIPEGLKIRIYKFSEYNVYGEDSFISAGDWLTGTVAIAPGYYNVVAAYVADTTQINPSVGATIVLTNCRLTDTALESSGLAADAKATGDAITEVQTLVETLYTTRVPDVTYERGSIKANGSEDGTSQYYIRANYIKNIVGDTATLTVPEGKMVYVHLYSAAQYQSHTGAYISPNNDGWWVNADSPVSIPIPAGHYIRYVVANVDGTTISPTTGGNGVVLQVGGHADNTFTQSDRAADAKATGDALTEVRALISEFDHYLERCGRINFTPKKGGVIPGGTISTSLNCLTTGVIDARGYERIKVITNSRVFIQVLQGSVSTTLRRTNTWINSGIVNIEGGYIAFNLYLTDENNETISWNVSDFDYDVVLFGEKTLYEFKNDVPESAGIFNMIRRAYQLTDVEFTSQGVLPFEAGDKAPGTDVEGMLYASVWTRGNGFVPQNVSYHTFMTAAKDPNSYLYTSVGGGDKRRPYYGCVCSTFAAWCVGFPGLIATVAMPHTDGFEEKSINGVNDLCLGDMFLSPDEHIALITGISRSQYGTINSVELAEAWQPFARRRWLPISGGSTSGNYGNDINWFLDPDNHYRVFRYNDIENVTYESTPWVHVLGESGSPTFVTSICPKKGDRAIYSTSEEVIIDVIDTTETSGMLKKGTHIEVVQLGGSTVNLGTLENGEYEFIVGEDSVSFLVVDVEHTVEAVSSGYRVSFTNNNSLAKPINVSICHPTNHGISGSFLISDEERTAGSKVIEILQNRAVTVMYETDFGWYFDEFTNVEV